MIISPQQIRAARAWLNWSAQELAHRSRVSHQTIAKYERGVGQPSDEIQTDLARALAKRGLEPLFAGENPIGIRVAEFGLRSFDSEIYPEQVRAARAWLRWSTSLLAERSRLSQLRITKFEHDEDLRDAVQDALRQTLAKAGIEPVFSASGDPSGIRVTRNVIPRRKALPSRYGKRAQRRAERMAALFYEDGWTLEQIGDEYGVRRQRVHDILKVRRAEAVG